MLAEESIIKMTSARHLPITAGKKVEVSVLYRAVSGPQDCSKHFTFNSLADMFNRKPSQLLWETFSHATINSRRLVVHK